MPPIEMTMSPVDDRICIDIPKKYRSYSFVVTLTPMKKEASSRRRAARRVKSPSAWDLLACPIFDEGEELDIRRDHNDFGRPVDL